MIKRLILPVVVAFLSASMLMVVRGLAFTFLHRWAVQTEKTKIEDFIRTTFAAANLAGKTFKDYLKQSSLSIPVCR